MERLLLCLDDLDDLVCALGFFGEHLRRILLFALATTAVVVAVAGCVLLAIVEPPLAMAAATLLFVTMMYRSVTSPRLTGHRT
jgi:hypothetical protein